MKHFTRAFTGIAALILGIMLSTGNLQAQNSGLVTVQSGKDFDQTVETLRQMISKNDMMVMSEINQGKILSMTGLQLNATSLFVGNPNIGNKLFSADRGVGVAVPVRVNIYEASDGNTYINYVKPSQQLASFDNQQISKIGHKLDQKLNKLTSMLAK
ncbi:MAG: DUF302 domain-containing protein [Candidatus Marinimicrobia bacterium]|nr:DUF302 domain-containing protein [Candidatus Neomarinimicrobiota bacterium]MCF7829422.1 DUF302 domain-containing protein [Candidatus Neomarinimicrobiota bacterium]MCF7880908.1 DUF302 domain-containing protein [Candidatus Neomarinimicrobiota bacterium]